MESFFLRRAAELSVAEVADATIRLVVVEEAPDNEDIVEDDAGLMSVYLRPKVSRGDRKYR
jgi:hypothetical protein